MGRYHGLDLLRGVAMLLGLVIHAGVIFTEPWVFATVLPETTATVPDPAPGTLLVILWIHLWRMPLFFLLAGFFAQMVIERRGADAFVADRALRVLCALLVFMTLFNWMTGRPWGDLDHLWFLWYLALFCGLAWALAKTGLSAPDDLKRGVETPGRLIGALVFLVPACLWLRDSAIEQVIPDTLFAFEWRGFVFYLGFFLFGQVLWTRRAVLVALARPWIFFPWLAAGLCAFVLLMGTLEWIEEQGLTLQDMGQAWALGAALLSAVATLGHVLGLMGLTHWAMRGPSRLVSAIVTLSYPIYLFHLYPQLTISALMVEAGWRQGAIMAVTPLAGLAISLVLYLVLVRYTPLDWLLAGPRKAWWRWPLPSQPADR